MPFQHDPLNKQYLCWGIVLGALGLPITAVALRIGVMRRYMVMRAFVLLLLLLFVSLGAAHAHEGAATPAAREKASHAILHFEKQAHHHHQDGSIAVDQSLESKGHLAADGVHAAFVGLADFSHPALLQQAELPIGLAQSTSALYLDRPKRPPRLWDRA